MQPRTRRRQLADQVRARLHQVLAVVQHDQQMPCTKLPGERIGKRLIGPLVDAHRPANGRCGQPGFAHPLQVHPTGPVGEPRRHVPGDLHRQPGLAAATRAGQRHHPGSRDQVGHLRPFTLAADERRDPHRQPAPRLHGLHPAPIVRARHHLRCAQRGALHDRSAPRRSRAVEPSSSMQSRSTRPRAVAGPAPTGGREGRAGEQRGEQSARERAGRGGTRAGIRGDAPGRGGTRRDAAGRPAPGYEPKGRGFESLRGYQPPDSEGPLGGHTSGPIRARGSILCHAGCSAGRVNRGPRLSGRPPTFGEGPPHAGGLPAAGRRRGRPARPRRGATVLPGIVLDRRLALARPIARDGPPGDRRRGWAAGQAVRRCRDSRPSPTLWRMRPPRLRVLRKNSTHLLHSSGVAVRLLSRDDLGLAFASPGGARRPGRWRGPARLGRPRRWPPASWGCPPQRAPARATRAS